MDKIWDRKASKLEVIGRCGGDEKNWMTTQNRQKSKVKKKRKNMIFKKFYDGFLYALKTYIKLEG